MAQVPPRLQDGRVPCRRDGAGEDGTDNSAVERRVQIIGRKTKPVGRPQIDHIQLA